MLQVTRSPRSLQKARSAGLLGDLAAMRAAATKQRAQREALYRGTEQKRAMQARLRERTRVASAMASTGVTPTAVEASELDVRKDVLDAYHRV